MIKFVVNLLNEKHMNRFIILVLLLTASGLNQIMAQCAMCRTTIENNVSAGETALGSGLNLGILYLFVTPYLIIATIAYFWYKKSRENAKKVSILRYPKP